jgi:hypothetical protein
MIPTAGKGVNALDKVASHPCNIPTPRYYHKALRAGSPVSLAIQRPLSMVPFMDIMGMVYYSGGVPVVMEQSITILRRTTMRQGTAREYEPMPHAGGCDGFASLQIVCAWCQQPLGWHPVQPPMPFSISYSICGRCYAAVARELAPLTARAPSPGRGT